MAVIFDFHMITLSKGADRKTIKTLTIDFKRPNQASRDSRKSTNEAHNSFSVETGFDFIYECPLTREFESKDLMRVHFGNRVPNSLGLVFRTQNYILESGTQTLFLKKSNFRIMENSLSFD